jgi:ribosome-associated toxin RatA of RatAB toxin-antitoxin module
MRAIALRAVVQAERPEVAFHEIADFERFPSLAQDVHHVSTRPSTADIRDSTWEVNFRRGIMRWDEREVLDPRRLRIDFEQTDGDFEKLRGSWQLAPVTGGVEVCFAVTYDFGIDSLAGIMDPIAERVMKRAVCFVLVALFGAASIVEGGEALSDLGGGPGIPGITSMGKSDGFTQPIRVQDDLPAGQA